MSIPFRERNPVVIGAISIAVIIVMMLAAFNADKLPLIGGGDTYYAAFHEAGGLKADDEVRIAGVRVGKVASVDLQDGHVRVEFRVDKGVKFGRGTGAAIKIKTLLGAMYLALQPHGHGQLAEGSQIPASRTTSPFDVVQAFSGLAQRSEDIDTHQLASALNTLATLTENTPAEFRSALKGVSRLSSNIAARDQQLQTLLTHMHKVSKVLGDRRGDLVTLMRDGDKLFRALAARRQSVHDLLVATSRLSTQLTGLVEDTRADLKPALRHLSHVVAVLQKNQDNLDNSLRLMAPFYRVFANTLGNGPWFDTYIQNLPPIPSVGSSLLGTQ
ncbi:MAG TPA: MCE family protein [Nocardioidaceae bacterium]|nr:MCE family protein [Nocardioidaceae bacterium]